MSRTSCRNCVGIVTAAITAWVLYAAPAAGARRSTRAGSGAACKSATPTRRRLTTRSMPSRRARSSCGRSSAARRPPASSSRPSRSTRSTTGRLTSRRGPACCARRCRGGSPKSSRATATWPTGSGTTWRWSSTASRPALRRRQAGGDRQRGKNAPYPDTGPLTFGYADGAKADAETLIDEVRISRVVRPVDMVPDAPFKPTPTRLACGTSTRTPPRTTRPASPTPPPPATPPGSNWSPPTTPAAAASTARAARTPAGPTWTTARSSAPPSAALPDQPELVTAKAVSIRLGARTASRPPSPSTRSCSAWRPAGPATS